MNLADTNTDHVAMDNAVLAAHACQHAINSTSDHTSSIAGNTAMVADANGLPKASAHLSEDANVTYLKNGDLSVSHDGSFVTIEAQASGVNKFPILSTRICEGTIAAPTAIEINKNLSILRNFGFGTTVYNYLDIITVKSTEQWSDVASGCQVIFKVIPNGSTTQIGALTLNNDGSIEAIGDIYTVPWTDWSGSVTVRGITSFSVKWMQYKLIGKRLLCEFYFEGTITCGETTFSFNLPFPWIYGSGGPPYINAGECHIDDAIGCASTHEAGFICVAGDTVTIRKHSGDSFSGAGGFVVQVNGSFDCEVAIA